MPIVTTSTQSHLFTGLPDLDDVLVYIEKTGASCRFTLVSYANAWTAHFTNLDGNESPIDRFLSLPPREIVRTLQWGTPEILAKERTKETIYLGHIVSTVREEILTHMEKNNR